MGAGAGPSLRAVALRWLAQREQSRVELRAKLLRHVLARTPESAAPARAEALAQVDAVLDWLESREYLSSARFVESRVHARSARFGNARIRDELRRHDLALPPELAQTLNDSETSRAETVRARRFSAPAVNAAEQARQMRFLIGRGFSVDVVRRVVAAAAGRRGGSDDDERTGDPAGVAASPDDL